jgi:zinc-ribbon domain
MANFCTQCGTTLDSSARFCTRCGATVVETAPAASAPPPAPVQPLAAAPPPAAAPAVPKSSSGVKIVLIILGVFVGLGILAGAALMFGIWGISRAVHVDPSGDNVNITTPLGNMSMGKTEITEAELGLPIYPGADADEQGSFRIGTSKGSMGTYMFRTSDSPEQVLEFYRGKLSEKVDIITTPEGGIITSSPNENEGYMITVGRDEDNGYTVISVVRGISAQ